ncbi:MAG TPA: phosphate ABC transporter ATP-binding protein PstB [Candidatus Baltobacteraceae bacterium]|nr:phosphate ABC transporter ATP-binding protein PstB [Candidatus Baltobacteraceae bacterium]
MRLLSPKMVIDDLNVYFGNDHVIKNVSMEIPDHEVTALIGPSAVGKTTALRALNRMHDHNMQVHTHNARVTGRVLLDDTDIYAAGTDDVAVRGRIGMVFQQANLFPMSIYNNVVFGARIRGIKDRRVLDEIAERNLQAAALWDEVKDRLNGFAKELSGGQQQRLCIARTLGAEPEILLMDEPTSALDPGATMKVEDLILELKQNYTIVIVTHNMGQAARISDNTAYFHDGNLIEMDKTTKIFTTPQNKLTEDFVTGRIG